MSDHGRVRNALGVLLKAEVGDAGHLRHWLYDGARYHTRFAHRLVLEAFVRPATEGEVCRHLDGNPAHNSAENLAWGTQAENYEDSRGHGTYAHGERHGVAVLTEKDVLSIRARQGVSSSRELAKEYGVHMSSILRIWNRRTWGWLSDVSS